MDTSPDQLVDRLAHLIAGWGLETPAIALLEANKPLSFVGSHALFMLQPITDFFVAHELTADLAALLGDRSRLEKLISRLEGMESGTANRKLTPAPTSPWPVPIPEAGTGSGTGQGDRCG